MSQVNDVLTYHVSDIVLAMHSNASYQTKPKARNCVDSHFFCANNAKHPSNNSAVITIVQIMKVVMTLATEAKVSALYINACEAIPVKETLKEMGQPPPQMPIQMENLLVIAVNTKKMASGCLKSMKIRFWWLQDQEAKAKKFLHPRNFNLGE